MMFIVFEGMDGAGKTTQLRALVERLKAEGLDVVTTREPGGSPSAEAIRNLVLRGEVDAFDPETELLLFTAARRDHVKRTVEPALARGALVLCDRYVDSTHALQGAGGVDAATIDALHARFVAREPDLVLFFVLDEAVALERTGGRGGVSAIEDRMERKGLGYHQKVGAILKERSQRPNCIVLDARGTIDEVSASVDAALAPHLAAYRQRAGIS